MDNFFDKRVVVDADNVAICRDESLCQKCGKCKLICNRDMAVDGYYDYNKTKRSACIFCGKCVATCPFGALKIFPETTQVERALNLGKKVVFFVSPAVRVAVANAFGGAIGENVEGKIVAGLHKIGASYVFDTTFGADLTTMEEAAELIERLKSKVPLFTSCCSSWVNFVETFIPSNIKNLSSCASPIAMQSATIKTYFANKEKINPRDIFSVAVAPCVAKKAEIRREEMNKAAYQLGCVEMQDTDAVLTTQELVELFKRKQINPTKLKPEPFDKMCGSKTGVTYGKSGGVAKAICSAAYFMLNGKNPPKTLMSGIKQFGKIKLGIVDLVKYKVKVAIICGTAVAREYLIENANNLPDFVEVMACPNGCLGGVGQTTQDKDGAIDIGLSKAAFDHKYNFAYSNPEIKDIYKNFYKKPLSGKAKEILHTTYIDKSENI